MNRAGLNGLCVAAGVRLLYMLFDPDMISWRERGPGGAGPREGPGPGSAPLAPSLPPARAALGPALQPWAAPSRQGSEAGPGGRGGATFLLNVSRRTWGGAPHPKHNVPPGQHHWGSGGHLGPSLSALAGLLPAALRGSFHQVSGQAS